MPVITEILKKEALGPERIPVIVDRFILEKRRWRVRAENGTDIAVDLEKPCQNGDILHKDETGAYFVYQKREEVIRIPIPGVPDAAAKLGWFLGNQHLQIEIQPGFILLAHDEQLLKKLELAGIRAESALSVFTPDPHSKSHHH